ncbi:hypothetical protein EKK58_05340 [Candidatus Dependentiae bacterium]|nr:MAG: hypothetical protein EKK58_05340 [Candidatus Dependentiae bacterium]
MNAEKPGGVLASAAELASPVGACFCETELLWVAYRGILADVIRPNLFIVRPLGFSATLAIRGESTVQCLVEAASPEQFDRVIAHVLPSNNVESIGALEFGVRAEGRHGAFVTSSHNEVQVERYAAVFVVSRSECPLSLVNHLGT